MEASGVKSKLRCAGGVGERGAGGVDTEVGGDAEGALVGDWFQAAPRLPGARSVLMVSASVRMVCTCRSAAR